MRVGEAYGFPIANVFHAGDGNLHPLILFDANSPDELQRTEQFAAEVLEKCIEVGGTITGEHGVGIEKIDSMCAQFSPAELEAFHAMNLDAVLAGGLELDRREVGHHVGGDVLAVWAGGRRGGVGADGVFRIRHRDHDAHPQGAAGRRAGAVGGC